MFIIVIYRRIGKPNEMCVALVKVRERVRKYTQQQALEELLSDNVRTMQVNNIIITSITVTGT